jgi:hypothetical protein
VLFNSFHFALFFLVVTTLYFLLTHKYKCMFLLGRSRKRTSYAGKTELIPHKFMDYNTQ